MRQWISAALKEPLVAPADRRHEAERLNRHRKAFLADLRGRPVDYQDMQTMATEVAVADWMQEFQQAVQSDKVNPRDT